MIEAPQNLPELLWHWWSSRGSSDPRIKLLGSLYQSKARRDVIQKQQNIPIPSTLIVSMTSVCNLSCQTCGVPVECKQQGSQLDSERFRAVLSECRVLGVGHIVVVGGEPLLRPDLENFIEEYPDLMFSVFTNGRLLTHERAKRFESMTNVVLWLNVSATSTTGPLETLPEGARKAIDLMNEYGLFKTFTVTLTRNNAELFSKQETLEYLAQRGATFALFFDVLAELGSDRAEEALSQDEREHFAEIVHRFFKERASFAAVLPTDEALFGGCGAAGRNFLHLSPTGTFEPCPFVPWSTASAGHDSLLDTLSSPYFCELRERSEDWELGGAEPCSYRAHSKEFFGLCKKHDATQRRVNLRR